MGNSPKLDGAIKFRRGLIERARGIAWAFLSIKLILKAVAERFNMLSDDDNMLILLTKTANVVDDIRNILLYKRNKRILTKLNNTLWFHRFWNMFINNIRKFFNNLQNTHCNDFLDVCNKTFCIQSCICQMDSKLQ